MTRTVILLAMLTAAAGCNAVFGVDSGTPRAGDGGVASSTSSTSSTSGTGGATGDACLAMPLTGSVNLTFDGEQNVNLVTPSFKSMNDVSGQDFEGEASELTAQTEVGGNCIGVDITLGNAAAAGDVFEVDIHPCPQSKKAFVEIDESDGPCDEEFGQNARSWISAGGGTITVGAFGPNHVLLNLSEVPMTALIDGMHTGQGTFTLNGSIDSDCYMHD